MMKTVKIKGTEYKVKSTLRAIFIFEEISGKAFEVKTLLDNYLFFYCIILANNPETQMTWDDFIDALDEDPEIYMRMNAILAKADEVEKVLTETSKEDGDGQKKS